MSRTILALTALVGALGLAGGADAREARHLFLVPDEAEHRIGDARVVARYPAFTLVEAGGADARRMRRSGADRRDDMRRVTLGGRALDPARDGRPLTGGGLALVQFVGPVKDTWLARLRATGARVVTYVAQNGFVVHGPAAAIAGVAELEDEPAVRAVAPVRAADKLARSVRERGRQRLAVHTLSGFAGAAARRRVAAAGRQLRTPSAVAPYRTLFVAMDAARAARLAADPGVVAVQASPEPRLLDERADQIVARLAGGDPLVPSTPPSYFAFHESLGLGTATFPFTVDVTDEGIDTGTTATAHPDFHVDGVLANPTRLDYVENWTSDPDATDCGGHGTINASIIGGFNTGTGADVEDGAGFNYGLGVAPRAILGGSKIFLCRTGEFELDGTLTDLTQNAYLNGARISSNSWGTDVFGEYDVDSREYDVLVRDADPGTAGNQQMVEIFAAGNAGPEPGSIGSPATGKNVIAVGASEGVRASGTDGCDTPNSGADDGRDLIDFSSRGPTADLRLKPDLVAPGTHITGARPLHAEYNETGVCNGFFPGPSSVYSLSSGHVALHAGRGRDGSPAARVVPPERGRRHRGALARADQGDPAEHGRRRRGRRGRRRRHDRPGP